MNRRRFFERSAGAAVLAASGAHAADKPSIEQFDQAAAQPVLKLDALKSPVVIDSIRLLRKGRDYFVHVRSKDGAEGVSLDNGRAQYLSPILRQLIVPHFIGKDARDLENHLWQLYRDNYKLQGLAFWSPQAWVEFAILDMLGRVANKPIGDLLGGVIRREVPFYVASGRRDTTPQQEVEYLRKLIDETGAKAVKYRIGGRMSRNADAMPGRTKALIPLTRKALGDAIDLHADSNSSYDPPQAIEVGRMLEEIKAVYYEEPCPFDHLEDTKKVADALTIPVAGGEQEFSERRFRWMIANRGVDIVQPDLHYYGGLIRSIRVARMAKLAGMSTTVHISGGFGFVYMLHFASCVPDIGKYQEFKQEMARYRDWFNPPLSSKSGSLIVPEGPGVGIADITAVLKGASEAPVSDG
ncbi:MAG: mandelate racemase/muconate lactonizing enzyme family protein [Bryobacteraceae bacterium]|nr:mandelate racemase/muconate lactonizing enzyme family protein [Bryobacteraceae bacterium]